MITVGSLKKALQNADDSAVIIINDGVSAYLSTKVTTAAVSDKAGSSIPAVVLSKSIIPLANIDEVSFYKDIAF